MRKMLGKKEMKITCRDENNAFYVPNKIILELKDSTCSALLVFMASYPEGTIFDKYELKKNLKLTNKQICKAVKKLVKKGYIWESEDERIAIINN